MILEDLVSFGLVMVLDASRRGKISDVARLSLIFRKISFHGVGGRGENICRLLVTVMIQDLTLMLLEHLDMLLVLVVLAVA